MGLFDFLKKKKTDEPGPEGQPALSFRQTEPAESVEQYVSRQEQPEYQIPKDPGKKSSIWGKDIEPKPEIITGTPLADPNWLKQKPDETSSEYYIRTNQSGEATEQAIRQTQGPEIQSPIAAAATGTPQPEPVQQSNPEMVGDVYGLKGMRQPQPQIQTQSWAEQDPKTTPKAILGGTYSKVATRKTYLPIPGGDPEDITSDPEFQNVWKPSVLPKSQQKAQPTAKVTEGTYSVLPEVPLKAQSYTSDPNPGTYSDIASREVRLPGGKVVSQKLFSEAMDKKDRQDTPRPNPQPSVQSKAQGVPNMPGRKKKLTDMFFYPSQGEASAQSINTNPPKSKKKVSDIFYHPAAPKAAPTAGPQASTSPMDPVTADTIAKVNFIRAKEKERWRSSGVNQAAGETDAEYEDRAKGTSGAPVGSDEEYLSRLSPKDRASYAARLKQAQAEEAKSRIEGKISGMDFEPPWTYEKQWVPGQAVPQSATAGYTDPRTKAHYGPGEFIPGHHEMLKMMGKRVSPAEQRLAAIQHELEMNQVEDAMKSYRFKRTKRGKVLGAALATAKVVGGVTVSVAGNLAGAGVQGIAGVAKGMQPGRNSMQRGMNTLAPGSVNTSMYANLEGLRRVPRGIHPAAPLLSAGVNSSSVPRRMSVAGSRMSVAGSRINVTGRRIKPV
jgi:hypothetical protein